jgi:AraC-like DNA-binding protein
MEALKQAIIRYASCHANFDGLATTPVPGLRMMCAFRPSRPMRSIYKPLVCLVLQGAKQMTIGTEDHQFAAGASVIVGMDAPVTGRVVSASQTQPYVALAVELDFAVLRDLMAQMPAGASPAPASSTRVWMAESDAATLDCGLRLMRLLDRPDAVPLLHAGIVRELHYWLLSGRHGAALRRLALPDSHAQRMVAAVQMLRDGFRHTLPVEQLAAAARMSTSSFHRCFKAMTTLTPVQFQKQLRLVEARRLMLSEGRAASRAAYEVGYESVSQFTREYARMFGAPPRRDVQAEVRPLKHGPREESASHGNSAGRRRVGSRLSKASMGDRVLSPPLSRFQ